MQIADFKGHRVQITFHQPAEANGMQVGTVHGVMHDYVWPLFTLSDISEAFSPAGNNITAEANLLNAALKGDVRNIAVIQTPDQL